MNFLRRLLAAETVCDYFELYAVKDICILVYRQFNRKCGGELGDELSWESSEDEVGGDRAGELGGESGGEVGGEDSGEIGRLAGGSGGGTFGSKGDDAWFNS